MNPCLGARHQRFAKVIHIFICQTAIAAYVKERTMGKLINCECGEVVRGDTDDELIAVVKAHVARDHPDLAGKLSREDILNMAEEEN
jgi:hypothetical protein